MYLVLGMELAPHEERYRILHYATVVLCTGGRGGRYRTAAGTVMSDDMMGSAPPLSTRGVAATDELHRAGRVADR